MCTDLRELWMNVESMSAPLPCLPAAYYNNMIKVSPELTHLASRVVGKEENTKQGL